MKILWMSSVCLTDRTVMCSGTWVPGLLNLLKSYDPTLEIVNLTFGNDRIPHKKGNCLVTEWMIPMSKKMNGKTISSITDIINQEQPDVIQVWGTEDIWGEYPFELYFPKIPVIIEIQGILASVSEEYYGGLTPGELLKCWNIKEFLKPTSSLPAIRHLYTRNVGREKRIIENHHNIGVQSQWSARVIETFNPNATLYQSGIALREPFYSSEKWHGPSSNDEIRVFSTALMGQPLKGGWILFRAFDIIKRRFPNAKLILAGVTEVGIRRSGFCKMLTKFAKRHNFFESLEILGPCSAEELAKQYRKASIFINPSNWESYSVVTAEAMYIGCPTVAAYSGAMPELGENSSVLYFPKGDFRVCASIAIDILQDKELSNTLSEKSIEVASKRQDKNRIASLQIENYKQLILKHTHPKNSK